MLYITMSKTQKKRMEYTKIYRKNSVHLCVPYAPFLNDLLSIGVLWREVLSRNLKGLKLLNRQISQPLLLEPLKDRLLSKTDKQARCNAYQLPLKP